MRERARLVLIIERRIRGRGTGVGWRREGRCQACVDWRSERGSGGWLNVEEEGVRALLTGGGMKEGGSLVLT